MFDIGPPGGGGMLMGGGIDSVWWDTYKKEDQLPLDSNTHPSGTLGKRIFPGKVEPDDPYGEYRKKVFVVAKVYPTKADVPVHFRVFDVDDPSASATPIDNESSAYDNRGGTASLENLEPTPTPTNQAHTDGIGQATLVMNVTMQPGDNFRVVAFLNADLFGQIEAKQGDDAGRIIRKWGTQAELPSWYQTEMLTVWRKLHTELDSMEEVPTTGENKNHVEGTIDSVVYDPAENETTVDLGQNLPDEFDDPDQYACNCSGEIVITGVGTFFNILESSSNWLADDTLVVSGPIPSSAEGKSYKLYDDDQFILPHYPDFGLMVEKFEEAYILPIPETDYSDNDVTFDRNITSTRQGVSAAEERRDLDSSVDYWVAYALGAYQGVTAKDSDGYGENDVDLGETFNRTHSVVYLEIIDDIHLRTAVVVEGMERITLVHETAHQFGLPDEGTGDGLLNSDNPNFGPDSEFTDQNISDLRARDYPGHP